MPQELISQFDRKIAMPIETFRQVQTINLRDAIPTNIRWEGMIVYVMSEKLSYVLVGGLSNSQWVDLGTLVDVTVRDNLTSTSTTDALSANQGRVLKNLIDAIPTGGGIWGSITGTLSDQTDLQNALNGKEPSFSKNTAFNMNFGTVAGTVSEGNHSHSFSSLTGKPTTISGYGITDFNSLGDARWLKLSGGTLSGQLEMNSGSYINYNTVYNSFALRVQNRPYLSSAAIYKYQRRLSDNVDIAHSEAWYDGSTYNIVESVSGGWKFNNNITALSFKTLNWEIVESGGVLQFKQGGTVRFQMKSTGVIEATNFKLGLV